MLGGRNVKISFIPLNPLCFQYPCLVLDIWYIQVVG